MVVFEVYYVTIDTLVAYTTTEVVKGGLTQLKCETCAPGGVSSESLVSICFPTVLLVLVRMVVSHW